jgi:hypothetical protein
MLPTSLFELRSLKNKLLIAIIKKINILKQILVNLEKKIKHYFKTTTLHSHEYLHIKNNNQFKRRATAGCS